MKINIHAIVVIILLSNAAECYAKVSKKLENTDHDSTKRIEQQSDMNECPILFKLDRWRYDEKWGDWGREQSWGKDSWENDTGVGLYSDKKHKSYEMLKDPKWVIIYIGPWKKVTLTYPYFLGNKKQIETEIRMIATQYQESVRRHYETIDDVNKNIPEQPLILLRSTRDLVQLCDIKWVSKYGYNAVADLHVSPWRWFTGKVLTGSGEIIEAKE